ncbi:hypothetical protein TVAG_044920 [Trichomonas vaginalis G3]|uniref:HECT domain-containing protein n=1 Tax=Trichomonas vaginalis (strain ATCC PRA-98 / G3) TaxID=412133 RepID=A2E8E0_TRIV3|nr:E3 ubiquitin-protein ligase trip12 family [Trichomonas vaginalis G3]EAY11068.1 hypothetical protein TVAG_044920 [Trichomonas vaginalis G3]KAI5520495.1 E3 ubiquitin-protein ligase trip12 family [Trichomonas vaginalis G3]|eukprot:XP_001323291.1 hypothetical protein [Trichomonas vaginalis G3]
MGGTQSTVKSSQEEPSSSQSSVSEDQSTEEIAALEELDSIWNDDSLTDASRKSICELLISNIKQEPDKSLRNFDLITKKHKLINLFKTDDPRTLGSIYNLFISILKLATKEKDSKNAIICGNILCETIPDFFSKLELTDFITQKEILSQLCTITKNFPHSIFVSISHSIISLFNSQDECVSRMSTVIFQNISSRNDQNAYIKDFQDLFKVINNSTSYSIINFVFEQLNNILTFSSSKHSNISLKSLNIIGLLQRYKYSSLFAENIIQFSSHFFSLCASKVDNDSQSIIKEYIQYVVDNFYNITPEILDLYTKYEMNIPIMENRLISELLSGKLIDKLTLKNSNAIFSDFSILNHILAVDYATDLPKEFFAKFPSLEKYTKEIEFKFDPKSILSFKKLMNIKDISPYLMYKSGVFEEILEFLSHQNDNHIHFNDEAELLRKYCIELLRILPFPEPNDPFPSDNLDQFLNKELTIRVKHENQIKQFIVPIYSTLYEIEAEVNNTFNGISEDPIDLKKSPYTEHFEFPTYKNNLLYISTVHMLAKNPLYKLYCFTIGRNFYITKQSLVHALVDSAEDYHDIEKDLILETQTIKGKISDQSLSKQFICDKLEIIFAILKELYRLHPSQEFQDEFIIKRVDFLLKKYLSGTLTRCSYVPWIVYRYPFMFPFELKYISSVILNNSLHYGADVFSLYMYGKHCRDIGLKLKIDQRSNSLEGIGNILVSIYSLPHFSFDIYFDKCHMSYQRFMYNYGKLYFENKIKNSVLNLKVYRDTSMVHLYPPEEENEKKSIIGLGVIVGKSLIFGTTLPFKLHSALFDAINGHTLLFSDVDELFANKMIEDEFFNKSFTYPDDSARTLADDLYISDSNMEMYREKVKSYTCGELYMTAVEEFKTGLKKAIDISTLSPFSGKELSDLLFGGTGPFEKSDLENLNREMIDDQQFQAFSNFMMNANAERISQFLKDLVGAPNVPFNKLSMVRPKIQLCTGDELFSDDFNNKLTLPKNVTPDMF